LEFPELFVKYSFPLAGFHYSCFVGSVYVGVVTTWVTCMTGTQGIESVPDDIVKSVHHIHGQVNKMAIWKDNEIPNTSDAFIMIRKFLFLRSCIVSCLTSDLFFGYFSVGNVILI